MKKFFDKKCVSIVLALILSFGLSANAYATSTDTTSESTESSSDTSSADALAQAQADKAALEKQLAAAKSTISDLKNSQGDIKSKVSELNSQLIQISASITDLENQLTAKTEDIEATKAELEQAKEDEAEQYEDMKLRIKFMYENGFTTYLDAFLESDNVSEFLNNVEYVAQIQTYDRAKLEEYKQTVENITNMEANLEQEYADLETMKASVEENKKAVAALMSEKQTELADVTDDISDAQAEADFYEAELQAQNELIAAIKRAMAEKSAAGITDTYTGGTFVWPCPSSTRVTCGYGPRTAPTTGASTNHKGIDIGASYGADIVAAAGGTVKAAAYSSAAGNYIMIDHGGGLYTVYMHASSLLVSEGTVVTAGQVIAKVGSTGVSTGNHLHFGVSLNGSYVNPWTYLGS